MVLEADEQKCELCDNNGEQCVYEGLGTRLTKLVLLPCCIYESLCMQLAIAKLVLYYSVGI